MFGAASSQRDQHNMYTDLRTIVGTNGAPARVGPGADAPPSYREATRGTNSEGHSQGSLGRRLSAVVGRR